MIKQPLVSVVINCYNGEEFVEAAINSVLSQTYQNFEIVFFDNMSTDKTRDIITKYTDIRVKYFCSEKHVSLGIARNLALTKTSGEYISFLDVDDLWYPDKLSEQIVLFDNPKIGMIYSNIDKVNSRGEIIYSDKLDSNKNFTNVSFNDLFLNYDVVMSSSIISKSALSSVSKSFDELLIYAEEYDLFMRICSSYNAIKVNSILTSYRIHSKQATNSLFERSILEEEYVLSKLSILVPDLVSSNIKILDKKNQKLAWQKFLYFISQVEAKYARKKLLPYIFRSLKFFIFYFLSFFGCKIIMFLWNIKREKTKNIKYNHK
jgi:glycosyltransferase involved in cell wall biosynthesis